MSPGCDAAACNNTYGTASPITPYLNGSNQIALSSLRISSSTDIDWYYVVAPTGTTTTVPVTVQSSNLSSFSPSVAVYNSALQLVGKVSAPASYGATVTYTINNVAANQGYYIKVVGADLGSAGQGTYGLELNFGTSPLAPIAPPNTVVAQQPDQGGGGSSSSNTSMERSDAAMPSASTHSPGQATSGLVTGDMHMITVGSISGLGDGLTVGALPASRVPEAHAASAGAPVAPVAPFNNVIVPLLTSGSPIVVFNLTQANPGGTGPAVKDHNHALVAAIDQALAAWPGHLPA